MKKMRCCRVSNELTKKERVRGQRKQGYGEGHDHPWGTRSTSTIGGKGRTGGGTFTEVGGRQFNRDGEKCRVTGKGVC